MSFVDFRNVWLAYNDELLAQGQFAVEDINLQVEEGEFIAIVGPSGCGKSTFMKLATGLKRPSKGTVEIGGREVDGPLKITGMAFQAPSLLPWRTTVQNVMLPLEIVEPYRSSFKQKKAEYEAKARPCCRAWAWAATRTSSLAALGRHAAARQHLPRADPRAQDAAARRALRRAGRLHPRRAVVRCATCRPRRSSTSSW
jgi:ABC-type Fe3+/spermidine/putrescine transport system ATPase subunit